MPVSFDVRAFAHVAAEDDEPDHESDDDSDDDSGDESDEAVGYPDLESEWNAVRADNAVVERRAASDELAYAIQYENVTEVAKCIAEGGDLNVATSYRRDDRHGTYPKANLVVAVEHGTLAMMELLLKAGADVNFSTRDGGTALYAASCERDLRKILLLLRFGANPDAATTTGLIPLNIAVRHGDDLIVERLISARADMNRVDRDGYTPLDLAVGIYYRDDRIATSKRIVDRIRRAGGRHGLEWARMG